MATTVSPTSSDDEQPPQYDAALRSRNSLRSYYVLCLLVDGSISALAVCMWSNSLGIGATTYAALEEIAWLSKWSFGMCFFVLTGLYLLDFFWPPHLPGQILMLWDGDTVLGRLLLCAAGLFLGLALLLLTPVFPSLPMVLTIMLSPICVGILRMMVGPGANLPKGGRMSEIVECGDDESKVQLLMSIVGQEHDTMSFLEAALAAFLTCSLVMLMLWVVFGIVLKRGLEQLEDAEEGRERDKVYLQWVAPIVTSVSHLVFALFSFLRIFMQRTYIATDICRNRLLAETLKPSLSSEALRGWRLSSFTEVDIDHLKTHRDSYLTRHVQNVKQLSLLVKVVGCAFVLLIGLLYVVIQLLYANSDIAFMVLALSAALFVLFILFVWVAFSRIVWAIGKWLHELPVWRTAAAVTQWPLTRAFFICPLLPALPLLLLASVVNQRVRRCRGLQQPLPRGCLTPRVAAAVESMRHWDRLAICAWCYGLCAMYVCYTICPLLLNVTLSWLRSASASWPFLVIVVLTFVLGVVLFLLPPVPGMTVYIFGGLVISGTCPPAGTVRGFWLGTALNIGMCWVLKLAACAVQQKCIGGLLGRSQWVRRTVGVHRMAIRCVEAELKAPGLTLGKVAILCGGPDWPTSVLAGVLGLSLWQCELGTMPVIGFVAPCAMTGSLYIKKGEGEVWKRSAHLMIVASVVVNLLLWGWAFWAIQNRMEANFDELSRRLPENVDLHWLDHRDETAVKRTRVSWEEMPAIVRRLYMLGAVLHIMTCHVLNWGYAGLFGDFAVQDDINTLVFWPRANSQGGELFTYASLVLLGAYVLAFAFPAQYLLWHRLCVAPKRRRVAKELDMLELEWKEAFQRGLEQDRSPGRMEPTICPTLVQPRASSKERVQHRTTSKERGKAKPDCKVTFQLELEEELERKPASELEPKGEHIAGRVKSTKTLPCRSSNAETNALKSECKPASRHEYREERSPRRVQSTPTLPRSSSNVNTDALELKCKAASRRQVLDEFSAGRVESTPTLPRSSSNVDANVLESECKSASQQQVLDDFSAERVESTPTLPRSPSDADTPVMDSECKAALRHKVLDELSAGRMEPTSTLSCCSSDVNSNANCDSVIPLTKEEDGKPLPKVILPVKEVGKPPPKVTPLTEFGGRPHYLMPAVMPEAPAPPDPALLG